MATNGKHLNRCPKKRNLRTLLNRLSTALLYNLALHDPLVWADCTPWKRPSSAFSYTIEYDAGTVCAEPGNLLVFDDVNWNPYNIGMSSDYNIQVMWFGLWTHRELFHNNLNP